MTSQPVAIPTIGPLPSTDTRPSHDEKHGLYFGLIDVSDSGEISWLISDGSGKFVQLRPNEAVPPLAFIVEKKRAMRHLVVEILSPILKSTICNVLGRVDMPGHALELDIGTILAQYESLEERLRVFRQQCPSHESGSALDLLLNGCLLDHCLYDGTDIEAYLCSRAGSRCSSLAQDATHKRLIQGLDELDDCFRLGLLPVTATAYEISAFNHCFEQLAFAGEVSQLQELVEPAVKSGEAEIRQDAALLANVLGGGHRDTHGYLLDLSKRTLASSLQGLRFWKRDVSTDPMYDAIVHDREDLARLFATTGHYFSGTVSSTYLEPPPSMVTPLTAAVYWKRTNIVRMLLELGGPYLDGWAHAVSWAGAHELHDILDILRKHKKWQVEHSLAATFGHTPYFERQTRLTEDGPPSRRYYDTPVPTSASLAKASATWHRGFGLGWDDGLHRFNRLPIFPSGRTSSTPNPLSWEVNPDNPHKPVTSYPAYNVVQPSTAQSHRVRIGQNLVNRLGGYCERVQFDLSTSPWGSPTLISSFSSPRRVWQAGMGCFRLVVRNRPPSTGTEAFQLLLVATVLQESFLVAGEGPVLIDHAKLRTILGLEEQPLYDELIWLTFNRTSNAGQTRPASMHELCRVQELAQSLVSTREHSDDRTRQYSLRGLRLPFIYGSHHRWQNVDEQTSISHKSINTPSSPVLAADEMFDLTTTEDEDDFDIFDYIKIEAVQEEKLDMPNLGASGPTREHDATWKNLDPKVVLLLGSHVCSAILHAIQRVQLPPSSRTTVSTYGGDLTNCTRPLTTLEEFCSIFQSQCLNSGDDPSQTFQVDGVNGSLIPLLKAWIQDASDAGDTLSQSLDPNALLWGKQIATLSPGDTSGSLSRSVPSAKPPKLVERLRCLSLGCPKTFSNVSNRNKHMREGCAFREHPGYRCRNEGCSKTLTTKWYRSTHEATRCRYRGAMGQGSASSLASEDSAMGGWHGARMQ